LWGQFFFWDKYSSIGVIENKRDAHKVSALAIANKTYRYFENSVFIYD
jgi:hypothetical protein